MTAAVKPAAAKIEAPARHFFVQQPCAPTAHKGISDTWTSMSANLDLVRSIYADWERGDFSRADWADPNIEYVQADGPDPGSSSGLAKMANGMRGWLSGWEEFRLEADEFQELDDERVLVFARISRRGKRSGVEFGALSGEVASVFHISHGKVTRYAYYLARDRALADLGLEE